MPLYKCGALLGHPVQFVAFAEHVKHELEQAKKNRMCDYKRVERVYHYTSWEKMRSMRLDSLRGRYRCVGMEWRSNS